jgi:hypothetical protein
VLVVVGGASHVVRAQSSIDSTDGDEVLFTVSVSRGDKVKVRVRVRVKVRVRVRG